jgi:hypothetical protein
MGKITPLLPDVRQPLSPPAAVPGAALVSGSPSLLTAAVSFSDTLVYRVPVLLAVSLGQGSLVSHPLVASGAASGLEALVSRSLAFPAASMFSGSLAGSAPAKLLSIFLYCRIPIMLQACLSFLPLDTCT